MSAQFGRWNTDGKPIDPAHLEKARPLITPYGPDGTDSYLATNIGVLYCGFHTSSESRNEVQPLITPSGVVITWDGRLDNRQSLIRSLGYVTTDSSSDVSIVAEAYQLLGRDCFPRLIGDWALSIWDPSTNSLLLVKDPMGKRHLYYSREHESVTWCTIPDPLILFGKAPFSLNEQYIAGWLSWFPAAHLTPYSGVQSVPPSTVIELRTTDETICRYWRFEPGKELYHRNDQDYEEHFREVFSQAVCRTLRSDRPILAELSGGMDSSSIVCVADDIIERGLAGPVRLDTVSYYNDSEPNWNERPYFAKVEEKRRRTGCHVDAAGLDVFNRDFVLDHFAATPDRVTRPNGTAAQYAACIRSGGNRVVLSGMGGDEVTGGVPTPLPELADHLAAGRWGRLAHQLKIWALAKRKPWPHLLFELIRTFLPPSMAIMSGQRPAPWIRREFVDRNTDAFHESLLHFRLSSPRPSFQDSLFTLDGLCRTLAMTPLPSSPVYEKRYPYLDRNFLEFLFSLPPEQLLRPGQRRSVMRRALAQFVPPEILGRKRKAFLSRTLAASLSNHWKRLHESTDSMTCVALNLIDPETFKNALRRASEGPDIPMFALLRTLSLETWLKDMVKRGILQGPEVNCTECKFIHAPGCFHPSAKHRVFPRKNNHKIERR